MELSSHSSPSRLRVRSFNRRRWQRSLFAAAAAGAALAALAAGRAHAQSQTCNAGGTGVFCRTSADCAANTLATVCVNSECAIPCQTQQGDRQPTACSLGETCVPGETESVPVWFCKASSFAMDLNLLDRCVSHFLDGTRPNLTSSNVCSMENNLNHLLDQDGNGVFNIFDVDGCLRAYLAQEPCANGSCPSGGGVYCAKDDDCGSGLYCSATLHRCERECGLVASREQQGQAVLERKCSRPLTVCDYDHGRCIPEKDLAGTTCQVDSECPAAAVCSMGTCAPKCQRSTDCSDSSWYCSSTNRCMPRPTVGGPPGFVFNPQGYSVLAGTKSVTLSAIDQDTSVPLLIMDLLSKKQVFDNKAVVFGYRLEVKYGLKQDEKCFANPIAPENMADCISAQKAPFITLLNPFGLVTAQGSPRIELSLNGGTADTLTPGLYMATVSVFFSNGGEDSFTVLYRKPSPSGIFSGQLSIYNGRPENLLGNTSVSVRLHIDRDTTKQWDVMLAEQGMETDGDIRDITKGYYVTGYIDGNDSMVFDQPSATTKDKNLIPVRGLYSPSIGRLRLIAAVDLPADFCRTDLGPCTSGSSAGTVRITNPFGRPILRVMHFVGPFDERALRFHGLYREVIHGLAPEAKTLEGGFRLDQSKSDESPVCDRSSDAGAQCGWLLAPLYASVPASADFPLHEAILTDAQRDVDTYCSTSGAVDAGLPAVAAAMAAPGKFAQYLGGLCQSGDGESCASYGPRILEQMVRLDTALQGALDSLTLEKSKEVASLTLNDFLRGTITLCTGGPSDTKSCIDPGQARCAMAIHRRALLSGEVSLGLPPRYQPGPSSDSSAPLTETLFCGEGSRDVVKTSCRLDGKKYPTTVALQEHNRFYKQLTQATRYQAANELSDALFAMYRAADSHLERAQVMSYKQSKLQSAFGSFDSMAKETFSPVSTDLLFRWPMARFDGHGKSWLKELHSVLNDRLQVTSSLIDLKRRVLANATDSDFAFAQHLMHLEYLSQAYLMFLQQSWEGAEFKYEGQGPAALEQGQAIVSRVTGDRNPLGLHPQQIYFENANITTSNWRNYRSQIGIAKASGGTGMLADVQTSVGLAVDNLKASLRDQARLLTQVQATRQQFEQTVDALCGSPDAQTDTRACEAVSDADRKVAMACGADPSCPAKYACTDEACKSVVLAFQSAASPVALRGTSCDLGAQMEYVNVGSGSRLCARGQMGEAIRQRQQLLLQRQQAVKQVAVLVARAANQARYINETEIAHVELEAALVAIQAGMKLADSAIAAADAAYDVATSPFEAADCMTIAGTAAGTDCVQHALYVGAKTAAGKVRAGVVVPATLAKEALAHAADFALRTSAVEDSMRRERMTLDNMVTDVQNLIAQYETLTGSLFSVDAKISDTRFLAEQAARRAAETNGTVIEHLIGGMNGDVLQRNKYVMQADAKFQDLLLATYKLTMAFVHSYNLQAQSKEMVNRVFQLMTPEDVADYLADLDRYEANYCGGAGIDCDSINNIEAFRFSVRDQLFPGLRDIVDARTGAVLTKGEQFHNIITSDAYLKTRQRAGQLVKQIEIPFSIWLNDRGINGAYVQQWMVSPLECNHIIAAGPSGTIAVNVIGTRLRNLTYELGRGNTDYIRQCEPVETTNRDGVTRSEYPINTFIVGYAPQNSLAQKDNTPSYVTHSNGLLACKNVPELGGNVIANESCFKYFARERSLGAPDWSLTIPFGVAYDNDWVFGADQAVIEDIIIYVRYRTRPI